MTKRKSGKRTSEEKILFDPYISVTTIERYFSTDNITARDIFAKAKIHDEQNGYLDIFPTRVRKEAVLEVLGLNINNLLNSYKTRKEIY